jgi:O-antigen biosynthesis protein
MFSEHKKKQVGLVAPRFVDLSGKLLEAGGIIFNDAKGWSYGRGDIGRDQHSLAAFTSVRKVDYGSAACVMVPTALFLSLDLYDRYFLPAYYEDTDMAFQVCHCKFQFNIGIENTFDLCIIK